MEAFTIGFGAWYWSRLWSRNPLVRRTDRIEGLVATLAVVLCILTVPIAGAVGTVVHESRTQLYAEQVHNRHQVTATATDTGDSSMTDHTAVFTTGATWLLEGQVYNGEIGWATRPKVGQQQTIWVDDRGNEAGPPTPLDTAISDAVVAGFAIWLGVALASGGLVYAVRRRLDRARYREWARELLSICDKKDWGSDR